MRKKLTLSLALLCLAYSLLIGSWFLSFLEKLVTGPVFLFLLFSLFPLGIIVLVLLKKEDLPKNLQKPLKIIGLSALGFSGGSLLHNLFYALAQLVAKITFLKAFFEILHLISFFLSALVSPLAFIIALFTFLFIIIFKK